MLVEPAVSFWCFPVCPGVVIGDHPPVGYGIQSRMSFQLTGYDPKVGNARSFIHAKVGLGNKICPTNLAPVACST